MNIFQAVLLGLLGGLGIWDSRMFGILMCDRPLVLGPLVGLILGDFTTGIIIGASLELVMMGVVGIGSATPPDTVSGTILATAFATRRPMLHLRGRGQGQWARRYRCVGQTQQYVAPCL